MNTSNTLQVKTYPEKAQDNPTEINGKEVEAINPPPSTLSLSLSVSPAWCLPDRLCSISAFHLAANTLRFIHLPT